jgi:hypothetical protein
MDKMRAGLIDEFLDSVTTRLNDFFGGWFAGFGDWFFLGKWWLLGFIILLVALVISWFFGALPVIGGWLRGMGGAVVLLYAAFLVGLTVAANHYKEERKAKPSRPIEPPPPPPTQVDNRGGGPFDWFRKG